MLSLWEAPHVLCLCGPLGARAGAGSVGAAAGVKYQIGVGHPGVREIG